MSTKDAAPQASSGPEVLTRHQAAQRLRVHINTLDRYVRDGSIPVIRVGARTVRISARFIDDLIAGVTP